MHFHSPMLKTLGWLTLTPGMVLIDDSLQVCIHYDLMLCDVPYRMKFLDQISQLTLGKCKLDAWAKVGYIIPDPLAMAVSDYFPTKGGRKNGIVCFFNEFSDGL